MKRFFLFSLFLILLSFIAIDTVEAYCSSSSITYIDVCYGGDCYACPKSIPAGTAVTIWIKYIDAGEESSYKYDHRSLWRGTTRVACNKSQGADDCSETWDYFSVTLPSTAGTYTYTAKAYAASSLNNTYCDSSEGTTKYCAITTTVSTYTLTVSKAGTGSGTVTSSPAGIDCGTDCTENYNSGTSVTLTATPVTGATFAGWSGACSGTGTCTLTMSADKSVTATFNDTTAPSTSISSPAAGSWQKANFSVSVSDSDTGGSGLSSCTYRVLSYNGSSWVVTKDWTARTCNSSFTVTVGASANCRNQGANYCRVAVISWDGASNGGSDLRDFSIDWTAPNTPTIDSPSAGSWQGNNFSVSVSGDGDTGGSGNNCYYHVYDSTAGWTTSWQTRTCNSSFTVTVGASANCRTQGSNKCTVYVLAEDGAGNTGSDTTRAFSIDYTSPSTSISSPAAGSTQSANFSVSVSDSDTGGSGLSGCNYKVESYNGSSWVETRTWTARTCNSSFTVTVGASADCRNQGTNYCRVAVLSQDGAGRQGSDLRNFSISLPTCSALNYPTDKWQRVWYDYGGSCLGDGPDETNAEFDKDWGTGVIAYGKSNQIQFASSRQISIATAGVYVFNLGSDDGAKLIIGGNTYIDDWTSHSYRVKSVSLNLAAGSYNVEIDYFENTGNARISFAYHVDQESTDCNAESQRRGYPGGECYQTSFPPPPFTTPFCAGYTYADLIPDQGACSGASVGCAACHNCGSAPSDTVTVGSCSATITGKGWDDTDGVTGGYKRFNKDSNWREVGLNDNIGDGTCSDNLKFKTSWPTISGDQITIRTDILEKNASNDLGAGFTLNAGACKYTVSLVGTTESAADTVGDELGTCESGTHTFGMVRSANVGNYLTWLLDMEYCGDGELNCGETCTSCLADCPDTTPPTTNIKIKKTSTGAEIADGTWLPAGTYTIEFNDSDNVGGSGLKECKYDVYSCNSDGTNCVTPIVPTDTVRICQYSFDIPAGKAAPTYNLEGRRYRIRSFVTDNANNSSTRPERYLWVDFTSPTTQ